MDRYIPQDSFQVPISFLNRESQMKKETTTKIVEQSSDFVHFHTNSNFQENLRI